MSYALLAHLGKGTLISGNLLSINKHVKEKSISKGWFLDKDKEFLRGAMILKDLIETIIFAMLLNFFNEKQCIQSPFWNPLVILQPHGGYSGVYMLSGICFSQISNINIIFLFKGISISNI